MAGAGLIPLMAGIKGAIMSVGASAAIATAATTAVREHRVTAECAASARAPAARVCGAHGGPDYRRYSFVSRSAAPVFG